MAEKICQVCGKVFTIGPNNQNRRKYCSDRCQAAMYRKPGSSSRKREVQDPKRKAWDRLHELARVERDARKQGLDYGTLTAKEYSERHPWVRPTLKGEEA